MYNQFDNYGNPIQGGYNYQNNNYGNGYDNNYGSYQQPRRNFQFQNPFRGMRNPFRGNGNVGGNYRGGSGYSLGSGIGVFILGLLSIIASALAFIFGGLGHLMLNRKVIARDMKAKWDGTVNRTKEEVERAKARAKEYIAGEGSKEEIKKANENLTRDELEAKANNLGEKLTEIKKEEDSLVKTINENKEKIEESDTKITNANDVKEKIEKELEANPNSPVKNELVVACEQVTGNKVAENYNAMFMELKGVIANLVEENRKLVEDNKMLIEQLKQVNNNKHILLNEKEVIDEMVVEGDYKEVTETKPIQQEEVVETKPIQPEEKINDTNIEDNGVVEKDVSNKSVEIKEEVKPETNTQAQSIVEEKKKEEPTYGFDGDYDKLEREVNGLKKYEKTEILHNESEDEMLKMAKI